MKKQTIMKKQAMTLVMSLGLFTAACGSDAGVSETTATGGDIGGGSVAAGTFRMDSEPNATPVPQCDLYTRLQLVNGFAAPVALLENRVEGTCEIAVEPAPRVFNLKEEPASCGSKHYVSVSGGAQDGTVSSAVPVAVEIIDHRARVCKDIVPAAIIVKEIYADGDTLTLYSRAKALTDNDAAVDEESIAATGELVRIAGIGGESTGYGLRTADGRLIELELSSAFAAQFVEGKTAEVMGVMVERQGVERTWSVLEVTSFELVD